MQIASRLKPAVIRCAGCAVLVWTLFTVASPGPDASFFVEIVDQATGKPTPAMVCITSLADGKWRTPPDGSVSPPYSTVADFYEPKPWKPGQ
ncbi:MAG: hypothetical protein NTY38_00735, partial [Acidobacteria bacterium]|nr:hypothetical protein [Acidobacteriota bacterium]